MLTEELLIQSSENTRTPREEGWDFWKECNFLRWQILKPKIDANESCDHDELQVLENVIFPKKGYWNDEFNLSFYISRQRELLWHKDFGYKLDLERKARADGMWAIVFLIIIFGILSGLNGL